MRIIILGLISTLYACGSDAPQRTVGSAGTGGEGGVPVDGTDGGVPEPTDPPTDPAPVEIDTAGLVPTSGRYVSFTARDSAGVVPDEAKVLDLESLEVHTLNPDSGTLAYTETERLVEVVAFKS